MAALHFKPINLLAEGFERTTAGQALSWALSAGRVVVIITELVVILAFLSRFWLDRRLTDLYEQNSVKRAQIESAASFENDFRSTQARIETYQELKDKSLPASGLIQTISSLLPLDVVLAEIYIADNKTILKGTALSEAGLAGYIKALSSSNKFSQVTLGEISLQGTNKQTIGFTINADLVKTKK